MAHRPVAKQGNEAMVQAIPAAVTQFGCTLIVASGRTILHTRGGQTCLVMKSVEPL